MSPVPRASGPPLPGALRSLPSCPDSGRSTVRLSRAIAACLPASGTQLPWTYYYTLVYSSCRSICRRFPRVPSRRIPHLPTPYDPTTAHLQPPNPPPEQPPSRDRCRPSAESPINRKYAHRASNARCATTRAPHSSSRESEIQAGRPNLRHPRPWSQQRARMGDRVLVSPLSWPIHGPARRPAGTCQLWPGAHSEQSAPPPADPHQTPSGHARTSSDVGVTRRFPVDAHVGGTPTPIREPCEKAPMTSGTKPSMQRGPPGICHLRRLPTTGY